MCSSHTTYLAFAKHVIEVTFFMLTILFPKFNPSKFATLIEFHLLFFFFQSKLYYSLSSYTALFSNTVRAFTLYFFISYLWLFLWPDCKLYKAEFSLITYLWQCNIRSINVWMNILNWPTWFLSLKIKNLLNRMGPWYLRMFRERHIFT